jgi:hypothetical protein
MPVTKEDLLEFTRFADGRLSSGTSDSLVDLAGEWEAQRREMDATVADIRVSHADIESGRVKTVPDAFAEIRNRLGNT